MSEDDITDNYAIRFAEKQAMQGLKRINKYVDKKGLADADHATKTLILDLADHYKNVIKFVKDYKEQNKPNSRDELFKLLDFLTSLEDIDVSKLENND